MLPEAAEGSFFKTQVTVFRYKDQPFPGKQLIIFFLSLSLFLSKLAPLALRLIANAVSDLQTEHFKQKLNSISTPLVQ